MLFDTVLAFDHVQHRILIIANARITADEDLESLYQFACAKIQFLERELERSLSRTPHEPAAGLEFHSNHTQARFEEQVRVAKEHIAAGDIYQVVLSQRFEADLAADPFTVYRALRHVNPSPYMYFIRMGGVSVAGSSPEMLVRVEGSRVETHSDRGHAPARPQQRRRHASGRGAEAEREGARGTRHARRSGTQRRRTRLRIRVVRVPQFMGLERFSHVMHLTSIVEGKLADDRDRLDALVSCFPAGGHGLRRAESARDADHQGARAVGRGLYAGAVGYLDFAGNLDFCIAIRTVIMSKGKAFVQAGAGHRDGLDPAAEYEETKDKAQALLRALSLRRRDCDIAECGLRSADGLRIWSRANRPSNPQTAFRDSQWYS